MDRGDHRRPDPVAAENPLIDAGWLLRHRDEAIVVDVRWYLSPAGPAGTPRTPGRRGRDAYLAGHIPGAFFVDLDGELAAPPGQGPGRHPLPSVATFQRVLSRIGARRDSLVVAYDDAGGAIAARMWWLMRYHGLGGGRVLDGGIAAWIAAGGALSREVPADAGAPALALAVRPEMVVDADAVAARPPDALLVDARAPERYRGEVEPVDPRAGHIPGAVNHPWQDNLVDGRMRDPEALAERYAAGDRPVIAYCGSGVTACHDLLALALAGRPDAKLYEGSWSDWSSDPSRPIG